MSWGSPAPCSPAPQPRQVGKLSQSRDEDTEVQRGQVPSPRPRSPAGASGLELWPHVWSSHAEEEAGLQPCFPKRFEGVCSLTLRPGPWSVNRTELSGCGRQNRELEKEVQNQREGERGRTNGPERGGPGRLAGGDGRSPPGPPLEQGPSRFVLRCLCSRLRLQGRPCSRPGSGAHLLPCGGRAGCLERWSLQTASEFPKGSWDAVTERQGNTFRYVKREGHEEGGRSRSLWPRDGGTKASVLGRSKLW